MMTKVLVSFCVTHKQESPFLGQHNSEHVQSVISQIRIGFVTTGSIENSKY